jgi:hypothetical protein
LTETEWDKYDMLQRLPAAFLPRGQPSTVMDRRYRRPSRLPLNLL